MEYQQKLITLPAVQDMKKDMTITAYEAEGTGLCYNAVGGDESEGWMIIHLASKKALCTPVETEYEIKLLLEGIASITDWHQSEKELMKQPKIAAQVRNIFLDVRGQIDQRLEFAMRACMPEYLVENVLDEMEEYPTVRTALLYAFKIVC